MSLVDFSELMQAYQGLINLISLIISIITLILGIYAVTNWQMEKNRKKQMQLEQKANVLPVFQGVLKELNENFEIKSFPILYGTEHSKTFNNNKVEKKLEELENLWVQLHFLREDIFLDFEDTNFKAFVKNLNNFFGIMHKVKSYQVFGGPLKNATPDEEKWQKSKEELIKKIKADFECLQKRIEEYLK